MFKNCGKSVCNPLDVICKTCLEPGKFHQNKEMLMFSHFIKKGIKTIKNYPPVSLLPISRKIFERINQLEIRGIFLGLSFAKSLHKALKGFLSNRKQTVILNSQCSSRTVPSGAPQCSISMASFVSNTH